MEERPGTASSYGLRARRGLGASTRLCFLVASRGYRPRGAISSQCRIAPSCDREVVFPLRKLPL